MEATPTTGWDMLMQPWPLKCTQCKKVWSEAPLIAQATGNAPSLCPECFIAYMKWIDRASEDPKMGCTITFNSWKPEKAGE